MSLKNNSLLLLCALLPSTVLAAPPKAPDLSATAEKIIADVLGVKEKEIVVIEADPADAAMIEELFVAVGKRGATPMLRAGWPNLMKKWLQSVPEARDGARMALEEKLLPLQNAVVTIEREPTAGFLNDVPPARLSAFQKSFMGLAEKRTKQGTRVVALGNGLAPSKENAKSLGLTEAELSAIFWAGIGTDYKALATRGEAVRAALPAGKDITVTSPAGTNLKLRLTARPMSISDGVISADDVKAGGPALTTWLPAGEVFGLIDPAATEGKVVVPRQLFQGEEIKDLTVTIKAGKITELTAKPSKAFDRLKALYDAAPAGKDAVSILDIGLNADVKAPKGKQLLSFVPAGTVTLAVGADLWAGGTNGTAFGLPLFHTDATLTVDGTVVIEKGAFKLPSVAQN